MGRERDGEQREKHPFISLYVSVCVHSAAAAPLINCEEEPLSVTVNALL